MTSTHNSNQEDFFYLTSYLSASFLDKFLSSLHFDTIWDWGLKVQDLLTAPVEKNYLISNYNEIDKSDILNLTWGRGEPIVNFKDIFPHLSIMEIPLSLNYLFQGNAKGKLILNDIKSARSSLSVQHFDWIRLHLIAQHIRHHGVLLKGLSHFLKERGRIYIFEANDQRLEFNPCPVNLQNMYTELKQLQKKSGGLRNAAQVISKRASTFNFKLVESITLPVPSVNDVDRLNYFRMFCIHIEIITRSFPAKFNRLNLFNDALYWVKSPKAWASFGLQFVIIEKKLIRGKKRRCRKSL